METIIPDHSNTTTSWDLLNKKEGSICKPSNLIGSTTSDETFHPSIIPLDRLPQVIL